jgi:pimeloyl-ACP methyl ester carboxylesterase
MAALARRQPSTERPGDIRVERYTMPDGHQRFALYVSGTRDKDDDGAFSMASNLPLYLGAASSSYESARIALDKAGAKPGDSVMVSGHSQGAMIASRLALEEEYEVPMLVGFGNPVQADVGADTLQVDFRHSDDFVPLLAAGGHDASIGATGSMVVERNVNPWPGIDSHQMDAYTETAEMLDDSSDPRMDAVRQRLAEFSQAESVEVFVYDTEEGVTPSSADAG